MATRSCSSCGGSGYNAVRGVMPGSQKGASRCSACGGSGWVYVSEPGAGGGSGGCFPKGTLIATPFGERDIAGIVAGDWVSTVDLDAERLTTVRVLAVRRHSRCRLWHLMLDGDFPVKTTAAHSFALADRWERASDIRAGDRVRRYDSEGTSRLCDVLESRPADEVEDVYNLVIEGHFDFIADSVLVHSFSYFRRIRMMGWRIIPPYFLNRAADVFGAAKLPSGGEQAIGR